MKKPTTMVHVRIEEELKNEVAAILQSSGLTVSDAVRVLFKKIIQEQSLPKGLVFDQSSYETWVEDKIEEALDNRTKKMPYDEYLEKIHSRYK